MKTYIFDIDGTICTNTNGEYRDAIPFPARIQKINKLYEEGHYIIYWTSRGMRTYKGNIEKILEHLGDLTQDQLDEWGCKYHELRFEKPMYDDWIDDKAMSDQEYFWDV